MPGRLTLLFGEGASTAPRDIWIIGNRHKRNPYVGRRVRCTWLRPWGRKPEGYTVEGVLEATFRAPYGRALIGEVRTDQGKKVSCPWSRNYLSVEVLD